VVNRFFAVLVLFCALNASAQILPNYGGQRSGLSAFSFLKNEMSPRSAGLAGASVSLNGDGYSAAVNPASFAELEAPQLSLAHLSAGAGIQQSYISYARKLANENVLAVTVNSMNSGAMKVRTEFQPEGTGELFYVGYHALGLSYSARLSEMFSAGISMNYLLEQIAGFNNHALTADIGFLYKTDFKDLRFAVVLQHFGGNTSLSANEIKVEYNRNGILLEQYTVPTVFRMGLSMVPWEKNGRKLRALAELRHPNDNSENIRLGVEYELKKMIQLRAGYKISVKDQNWPAFGLGYRMNTSGRPLMLSYALNPTNHMGMQHHFGLNYEWSANER